MNSDFQERIIAILQESPNGLTSNEIAERLGATAKNLSSRLSKLAAYGIIGKTRYSRGPRGSVYRTLTDEIKLIKARVRAPAGHSRPPKCRGCWEASHDGRFSIVPFPTAEELTSFRNCVCYQPRPHGPSVIDALQRHWIRLQLRIPSLFAEEPLDV